MAPRSASGRDAPPSPRHPRAAGGDRRRRDVDAPTLVLEGLAGLRPEQDTELLLGDAPPPVVVDAVHLVLGGAVADRCDVADPAPADDVDDRHLLGEAHRVVQRQQHDRHRDRKGRGTGGHGAGQDDGRRQVPVVGHVVLAEHRRQAAPRLGPGGDLERGLVELGGRGARRRSPHVEAQGEHRPRLPGTAGRLGRRCTRLRRDADQGEDRDDRVQRTRSRTCSPATARPTTPATSSPTPPSSSTAGSRARPAPSSRPRRSSPTTPPTAASTTAAR